MSDWHLDEFAKTNMEPAVQGKVYKYLSSTRTQIPGDGRDDHYVTIVEGT